MARGPLRDGGGEIWDGLSDAAELGHQRLAQQGMEAMTPSSVVKGVAVLMARRRCALTSAARS